MMNPDPSGILKNHPLPWGVGKGYEQQDPGIFIQDANGLIVYAEGDVPMTVELAVLLVATVNTHRGLKP